MRISVKPSETAERLKKIQHKIHYWNRQYARVRDIERRQETRRKIQLGGLVKKAGLDSESTAVLYGLLLEALETLQGPKGETIRREWKFKGDIALSSEMES